jgi:hypothetical protein
VTPSTLHGCCDELRKIAEKQVSHAALYKALREGSKVKIRVHKDADQYGGGYYDQVGNEIVLSKKDYSTLAHELGHAELHEGLGGKAIQHPLIRKAFFLTPLAALGAAILVAKGKPWGAALPLVTATPTLLSEGLATRGGRKMLEQAGVSARDLATYNKAMWTGFKSYLTAPVRSFTGAAVR